ncbi:nucleotidyltransferase domain-containing protein [Sphingomonas sp. KR3-1]|uniref:nucleotidyltransferase domain-containing protein n=1 Tax=Sphingomonas sp. KR3-1 TaxID=3156611 RepID=UPI0032B3DF01
MKTELDHLPERQQREMARVRDILLEEFDKAIATATKPHKRDGKVYKIILFGSYARSDWVDEPENGYQSDFDLLIVVSHEDLTDIADYWYVAEDRIARDATIARPVNIIVHSLDEVNQALRRGEYFWTDIARDGVAIYELPCHPLATPMPLSASDAYRMAQEYFDQWLHSLDVWIERARISATKAEDAEWRKAAAFDLHQSAERAYTASCSCGLCTSRARITSNSYARWQRTRNPGWSRRGLAIPRQIEPDLNV